MIAPGQTLENPVTGERFSFIETAATTGGELLSFELGLRPGGAVPIPHVHPTQSERFEVVAGRMRFRLGLRTVVAEPGDVVDVTPGTVHGFANAGDDHARVRASSARSSRFRGVPRRVMRPACAIATTCASMRSISSAGRTSYQRSAVRARRKTG